MFTAPTALARAEEAGPGAAEESRSVASLRTLFLAGEPLDEPTAAWIADALGKPVVDNYWQTETGWPMLAIQRGVEALPPQARLAGRAGVWLQPVGCATNARARPAPPAKKACITLGYPLPPGCMSTVWGDDARFVNTYWSSVPGQQLYSTFDWGIQDDDGYVTILGRTDDVINVAGHRLGTREIEEALSSHTAVAEVAVVGVADRAQGPGGAGLCRAARRRTLRVRRGAQRARGRADHDGRPPAWRDCAAGTGALWCAMLPKTRSGKLLRRAIAALAEGRDPATCRRSKMPAALQQVRDARWAATLAGAGLGARLQKPRSECRSNRSPAISVKNVANVGCGACASGSIGHRAHDRARHAILVQTCAIAAPSISTASASGKASRNASSVAATGDELVAADDEPTMHTRQLCPEARR